MPSKKRNHRSSTSSAREIKAKQARWDEVHDGSSAAETDLDDFVKWATSIGIELNGAAPKSTPGAGTGLVTTRHVKRGEVIVHVPGDCMMNPLFGVPGVESKGDDDGRGDGGKGEELSPQAQLAVALNAARKAGSSGSKEEGSEAISGIGEWYNQCSKHWPSRMDFQMALLWLPPRLAAGNEQSSSGRATKDELEDDDGGAVVGLRDLLPPSVRNPLERLEKDLAKDKAAFRSLLKSQPDVTSEEDKTAAFEYHWTLTNTRSFFWKPTGTRKGCMVMCPVLDFVNHASHASKVACEVVSTTDGYTLKANRDYEAGEEIYACYGAHSNDKLLVHYGFTLPDNKDDSLPLSSILLPHFTTQQLSALRDVGYEGNYSLDPTTHELCFRTQVAIRSVLLTANEWEFFMGSGEDIGVDLSGKVEEWVKAKARTWLSKARESIGKVEDIKRAEHREVVKARIELVLSRWRELESGFRKWIEVEAE